MAELTINICDVCQVQGKATTRFAITVKGRSKTVDLCDEHSEYLESLWKIGKRIKTPESAKKNRSATRMKGTTMEEIEAQKNQQ